MPDLQERLATAVGERYTIEEEIGRGGMGVVYRALDRRLKRRVAIKVLPPDLAFRTDVRSRFLREAQTAARLSHPHIVPIFEVDEGAGLVYFVMALVDGESLAALLARGGRCSTELTVRVLRDVADALAAAHAGGIIHRDIKPDNILLEKATGRATVTDFGIARAVEGDARLTATGIAVGTPAYMSPEQALGGDTLDGRSDVYSLAVVGYQMLAGEPPFTASNTPAMLAQHLDDPPASLAERRPDVPPALAAAIMRGLEKRLENRWPDAASFRDALDRVLVADRAQPAAPPAKVGAPASQKAAEKDEGSSPPIAGAPPADVRLGPREDLARLAREVPAARIRPSAADQLPPARKEDRLPPAMAALLARPRPAEGPPPGRAREPSPRDPRAGAGARPSYLPPPPDPGAPGSSGRSQPLPAWMPDSWRDVRRQWRSEGSDFRDRPQSGSLRRASEALDRLGVVPVEQRIVAFRRQSASTAIRVGLLAAINAVTTPFVPWFLFPAAFMGLRLARRGSGLWAEGLRFKDVFGPAARSRLERSRQQGVAARGPAGPSNDELAAQLAPRDVLAGPYGDVVRRAADDQRVAREAVNKLAKTDREMIPDVEPTLHDLAERVGALAQALHRLDADVHPGALEELDGRIAALRADPTPSSERERTLALLERQRGTLADLRERRESLAAQIESASLMLQNMRLDLLALGSAGVQASIDAGSSPTQEARALSREIGYVLGAAKEIQSAERRPRDETGKD